MLAETRSALGALTLIRPWDVGIVYCGKPVENRGWMPPRKFIGQRIAIHAGLKWDQDSAESILTLAANRAEEERWAELFAKERKLGGGRIIGTARLARAFTEDSDDPLTRSRWFVGPIGWALEEPFALPEPVPARGALGLWIVPHDAAARVLAQEAARAA